MKEIIPGKEDNAVFSFPSDKPSRKLDYIFYPDSFALQKGFVDKSAGTASDHLPAVSVFEIP
jgi:endonuclease/exonuclease/phosphatase family metal-dependent hydrolase